MCVKRPFFNGLLALFFLPSPPEEEPIEKSFRTLPSAEIQDFHSDTLHALRRAKAMQLALRELSDGSNPAPKKIFRDLMLHEGSAIGHAVTTVRNYMGVSLQEQRHWRSGRATVERWRNIVQDVGVFVFKRSMKQRTISGFSLSDSEFPVIYLNNSTSVGRQLFSIFHELAHVLLNVSGITKSDTYYIGQLAGKYRRIEVFCNAFAAEFLVPSTEFAASAGVDFHDDTSVKRLADSFGVSREVILRRALDFHLVDQQLYRQKAQEWAEQARATRSAEGGGEYYATQVAYLGSRFLDLAFRRYHQGRCSREELAEYLNVKARSLDGIEHLVIGQPESQ